MEEKEILKKETIKLSRKEIIGLVMYLVFSLIAILLVNNHYFYKAKESALVPNDEHSIVYPSEEDTVQVISIPVEDTYGIKLYMTPDSEENSSIVIDMLTPEAVLINQWVVNSSDITDEGYYFLSFDGIELTQNGNYYLKAWSDEESSIGIRVGKSSDYGYGSVAIDGKNWVYTILYNGFNSYVYSIEIGLVLLGLIAFLLFKRGIKETTILSVMYVCIALVFLLITPYNSLFDEEGHFLRSFEISEGHFLSGRYEDGRGKTEVPAELYNGITNVTKSLSAETGANFLYTRQTNLMDHNFDNEYISVENKNQALYSPASYIPQTVGLFIGKLITKNVFLLYGFGRFFAFLVNTLLIIAAIKLMPSRKMYIFALALNPVFLAQAVSYSADGTLNAIAIFFAAYIFMLRTKEKISAINKILVFIMSLIIALSKVIYFPIVLLVFLIKDVSIGTKAQAYTYKFVTFITSAIAGLTWFLIAKTYLFGTEYGGVMPQEQFKYLLTHFYLAPQIAFNTISREIVGWISQLFGGVLGKGWLIYDDIIWLIFGIIVVLELFICRTEDEALVAKKEKAIIAISLLMIVGLTFSSLYIQWTPYKANSVMGIQGRYFIPIMLPLGMIVNRKCVGGKNEKRTYVEMICLLFAVMMAAVGTIRMYI